MLPEFVDLIREQINNFQFPCIYHGDILGQIGFIAIFEGVVYVIKLVKHIN